MIDQPQTAWDCFDYVMNTQSLYRRLGSILEMVLRGAKRRRWTPEEELHHPGTGYVNPMWSYLGGDRRWWKLAGELIHSAREDYKRCFATELEEQGPPDWWSNPPKPQVLLACALLQRDRWSETAAS